MVVIAPAPDPPRISAAADRGQFAKVADDLSMATRSCVVIMLPISVLLTVLGPEVGTALFSVGQGRGQAAGFGIGLAWGAFGLLPYTVTLLQCARSTRCATREHRW